MLDYNKSPIPYDELPQHYGEPVYVPHIPMWGILHPDYMYGESIIMVTGYQYHPEHQSGVKCNVIINKENNHTCHTPLI